MAGKQMIDEPPTTAVMMSPRKPVPVRKKAVRASMRMGARLLQFPSLESDSKLILIARAVG
jgi:hypothetical protein